MRCTISLCQSTNTYLIQKTLRLHYKDGGIVGAYIEELWLCSSCGTAFKPSVTKAPKWHFFRPSPFKEQKKVRLIPKSWIVEEVFGAFQEGLSLQQLDILKFLSQGLSTTDICESLHIGPPALKRHLRLIQNSLGTRNRANSVAEAAGRGLLD